MSIKITVIVFVIMSQLFPRAVFGQSADIKKIGILVAMEKEYDLLRDVATDGRVVVVRCGIGKVNAAMRCVEMIRDEHPDVVFSIGCAGGNGKGLHLGDAVVSTATAYHDVYCGDDVRYGQVQGMPERYESVPWLVEQACQMDERVVPGLIVSGDWFVDTKEKMTDILDHFPEAKAVDMESAAIAQVCYAYNIPFVSLRIVSDMPMTGESVSQYADFWNTVSEKTFSIAKEFTDKVLNK